MIFNDEKYMTINEIRMGKNGFKSLSFETSKYSGSFSASRGFGSFYNEKNLNQIDIFNVEFVITKDELKDFALVYAQFKAFGVLPILNEYILNKIKSTLAYEKSLLNLSKEDFEKMSRSKTIKYINVFLEQMQIRSINRSSNGYEVTMTLSLHRFGFSEGEYNDFRQKFIAWDKETKFSDICLAGITKNSDFGGIELEYISIEKLNEKQKQGVLMQTKNEYYTQETEFELVETATLRDIDLKKASELSKTTKIEIPEQNILEIELITYNNISNLPLYGEPIGVKSFMGIGSSTFIAKMIFDESDSEILNTLKTISDKDTTKAIMNIKNFLPNILDFNSASVTKIYFNNTEEANGVIVTIIFEINAYYHDLGKLMDMSGQGTKELTETINSTLSFQQIEQLNNVKNNNIMATSFWLETSAQQLYLSKTISDSTLKSILNTPIESYSQHEYGSNLSNLGLTENASFYSFKIEDYLKSYTSYLTRLDEESFATKIDDYNKLLNIKQTEKKSIIDIANEINEYEELDYDKLPLQRFKVFLNKTIAQKVFVQDMVNTSTFYNYFDGISLLKFFGSEFAKSEATRYFNSSKDEYNTFNLFVNKVINEIFNTNATRESKMVFNMKKFYYASFLGNLHDIVNRKTINIEDFITSNGLDFIRIKIFIDNHYDFVTNSFYDSLRSPSMFDEAVSFVIEEMRKNSSEYKNELKETENISAFTATKDYLKPYYEYFVSDFKNKMNLLKNNNEDVAYNIFLTKLNYAFTKDFKNVDYKNTADLNKYINSLALSSSLMSLLLVQVDGMTSHFGFLSKDLSNNIGYKLNNYLYIGESLKGKDEVLKKCFGVFKINSYCESRLSFFPWVNLKNTEEIKKDYNYFFGEKLEKSSIGIFRDCLISNESILVNGFIDDFIDRKKLEFINNCENNLKNENINPNSSYPTSHVSDFFEISNNKTYINNRMKKRIIGNMDPFNVISKIKDIFCNNVEEAIPDYRVVVGNTEKDSNKGVFLNKNIKNYFEVTNIAEIKVSKNPKNKIKSANIIILDFNKQLINLDSQGNSISVKAKVDGKLEIFEISLGDNITIELGYGENRKNVFNGYISTINNSGNVIEINASGYASSLYSNVLKNVDFGVSPLSDMLQLVWKGAKQILGQGMSKDILMTDQIYYKYIERTNYNEHLFAFGKERYQGKTREIDYSIPDQIGFENSMFIVFTKVLALLPKNVKDVISGYTQSSGVAVLFKKILEDNKESNGATKTGDLTNIDGSSNIYKNIFNVDVDYENYGIVNWGNEQINSSGSNIEPTPEKPIEKPTPPPTSTGDNNSTINKVANELIEKLKHEPGITVNVENVKQKQEEEKIKRNIGSDSETYLFPTKSRRITSKFGELRSNGKGGTRPHKGIDIGTEKRGVSSHTDYIYCCKSGIVDSVFYHSVAGNTIVIDHGGGIKSRYLHLAKLPSLKAKDIVKQGQKIGIMGNTGASRGKHLHFEILVNKVPKNPMNYINSEYEEGDYA
ncbi:M23 family metallopeptidase [Cetobacterium sp.]|uniref:M23 family metallopeptidase n=1 Tax=Cetobacterium sp. TaxID=2071632 RepID=UPI003F38E021